MKLKFEIIWTRIRQFIRLWNDISFYEIPWTSQMISNFFETLCITFIISFNMKTDIKDKPAVSSFRLCEDCFYVPEYSKLVEKEKRKKSLIILFGDEIQTKREEKKVTYYPFWDEIETKREEKKVTYYPFWDEIPIIIYFGIVRKFTSAY